MKLHFVDLDILRVAIRNIKELVSQGEYWLDEDVEFLEKMCNDLKDMSYKEMSLLSAEKDSQKAQLVKIVHEAVCEVLSLICAIREFKDYEDETVADFLCFCITFGLVDAKDDKSRRLDRLKKRLIVSARELYNKLEVVVKIVEDNL